MSLIRDGTRRKARAIFWPLHPVASGFDMRSAEPVTFGTDANGKPITWKKVDSTAPDAVVKVDEQGRLHLKFGPNRPERGSTDVIELQATDAEFFGTNENHTPWIEFSWIDNNVHNRIPNITVGPKTLRALKTIACSQGRSSIGPTSAMRTTRLPTGTKKRRPWAEAVNRGDRVDHRARIGKESDGTLWFVLDGNPLLRAS